MAGWFMGLATGFVQGVNDQIEESQKREKQYIQDRMKLAASTRLDEEKKAESLRKQYQDRVGKAAAMPGFNSLTEAQKLAIVSNDTITDKYLEQGGRDDFNVNNFIDVNADAIPKGFTTVQEYVNGIKARPKDAMPEQMQQFDKPDRNFGVRTGTSRKELDQNAARFGMTGEEAVGWEKGAQPLQDASNIATLKKETFAPDSFNALQKDYERQIVAAMERGDTETVNKLKARHLGVTEMEKALSDKPEMRWQLRKEAIMQKIVTTEGAEKQKWLREKAKMEQAEDYGVPKKEKGDKQPTGTFLLRTVQAAQKQALEEKYGKDFTKGVVSTTNPDGTMTFDFTAVKEDKRQEVIEYAKNIARGAMQNYVVRDTNGNIRGVNPEVDLVVDALQVRNAPIAKRQIPPNEAFPPVQSRPLENAGQADLSAPTITSIESERALALSVYNSTNNPEIKKTIAEGFLAKHKQPLIKTK